MTLCVGLSALIKQKTTNITALTDCPIRWRAFSPHSHKAFEINEIYKALLPKAIGKRALIYWFSYQAIIFSISLMKASANITWVRWIYQTQKKRFFLDFFKRLSPDFWRSLRLKSLWNFPPDILLLILSWFLYRF